MSAFLKATVAFIEVILYITGVFTADTTINYGGNEYIAQEISAPMTIVENGASDFVIVTEENPDATVKTADITEEQLFNVETANLSWEYYKANQFLDKYTILNPFRHKRIEELYDSMLDHGITKVSGFQEIPPKDEINFMQRPYNWG